jgi:hypothetical protein
MAHLSVAHSFYRLRVETCSPYLEHEIMPQYHALRLRPTQPWRCLPQTQSLLAYTTGKSLLVLTCTYPLTFACHSISAKVEVLSHDKHSPNERQKLEAEMGQQCKQYTQRECRQLCEAMCSRLPLELREMVNEEIMTTKPPAHFCSADYFDDECFR